MRLPHVGLATIRFRGRLRARAKLVRAAFGFLLLAAPATVAAQVYYVDQASPACSPSGPGTEAQPYCTISAAVAAHSGPGITINVKPGLYREQVTVPASGAAGNPMLIQALGGPVIVDGADDFSTPAQWALFSGDVHLAAGVTWSPLQVFRNGARLTPSSAAPASLPSGSFRWVSGQGLYVNVGGGNPGAQSLLVGRRTNGFSLNARSWVTISGFEIRYAEDRGINIGSGCANLVLSGNRVTFCYGYGIRCNGSTAVIIENNLVTDCGNHGIGILTSSSCVVRGNESARHADPAVVRANGIHMNASPNTTVSGNRAHDNQDTGIQFSTTSDNCIAFNNASWNNGDHGYDHLGSSGTIHTNDVAWGNYRDGFSMEGTSPNTQLHNCISVENGLTTSHYDLWVDASSTPGFVSNHNILWNSTSQAPIRYIATNYTSLAAYQAASGQDAQSLQADPRFVNAAAGDFQLLAGSPAIDAANSGAPNWPATDATGHVRIDDPGTPNTGAGPVTYSDRGAVEFLTGQAPVVTAPATATVAENGLLTINVTAADPDGDAIASLTATGLPAGATFTPGPGNTSGTLSWTPDYSQAGSYSVTFTANNVLTGSASTAITVTNTDRAPVVTAPATATVAENSPLTVNITAADPDGEAIASLSATGLPAGATFTPGPGNASGTLTWTPGYTQSGSYGITFTASNALSGSGGTVITVTNVDRAPVVTAPATATVAEAGLLTVNVTAADPDGDPIASLAATGVPAGATFTPGPGNTSGTLTWTPDYSQAGSYGVTFTASNALSGSAITAITVTNTDRAPVVTAPATATVAEAGLLTVNVTAADPDGDPITSLTAPGLPTGASFTPGPGNTSGTLTWTPDYSQAGSYVLTFTASNAISGSGSTAVTVTNVDRAPIVTAPATATVAEGGLLTVNVTAADPDGDAISSLTASGLPAGATFTPDPGNTSGTLAWTPDFSQAGGYSVTFTASNALSSSGTTDITVTNTDRAPVVTAPATASVAEAGLLTVNVTASDPDGDAIASLDASGLPAGAVFTPDPGNTSGTLTWMPDYSQSGSYSVTFTASNALTGSGTTDITVTNTDRAPVVTAPATATVAEAGLLTVNVTASDPDGDAITSLDAAGLPPGATLTPGPGNTSGTLSWTPDYFQAGSHALTFTAANALSGSATTDVTVTNTDRAPVVMAPATATGVEGVLLTVEVTAADPDGEPIASLDAVLPAGATFTPGPGNTSGTLSWTPDFTQAGSHGVTFTAGNALSGSATTDISIANTDRAPVVTAPATATVAEDGLLTVNVTAADPDGDPVASLDATGLPAGATFTPDPGNTGGTLSWTPDFTQAGSYGVTFTASNVLSGSATTDVTVTNTDRAPVVTAPAAGSVAEGGLLTLEVTAADPDGEPITSLDAVAPAGATFTPGPGNTSGTLTWTPDYFQAGSHTITFTASNALSGSGSTAVTVSNVDRAPAVTAPATVTVAENAQLTMNVTAADPDGEAIASLAATGLPPGATFVPGSGNTSGTLIWTPDFTQAGSYSVSFTASNALSGSTTTSITVTNTDRAPVVTAPATATVAETATLTVNVTAADPDGDPIASLAASGLPSGATFTPGPGNTSGTLTWTPNYFQAGTHPITFTASNALSGSRTTVVTVTNVDRAPVVTAPPTATVAEGQLLTVNVTAFDPDGEPIDLLTTSTLPEGAYFEPTPDNTGGTLFWEPNYSQAGSYGVSFTASNALSGTDATHITVSNTDRAPVVTSPATVTVAENAPLTVNVTAADPDGNPIISLTASGVPPGATFTPGPGNTTGTLSWTPDFTQAGSYSVRFTATNARQGSDTTVITVTNTDRAPVVTAPATATVAEGQLLTVSFTAADPDGEPITSLAASAPPGATLRPGPGNSSGTLTWTPDFTQAGSHTLTFTASNALPGSGATAVTVTNVDLAPVVTAPATATVAEDGLLTVNVTAADPDGDPITSLTATGVPAGATFTPDPGNTSGTLSWTPDFTQAGGYSVTFTASNALSDAATTDITVTNTDRAPVVTAPATATVAETGSLTVNVTAADPDGDPIASLDAAGLPAGATFTPDPGNTSGTLAWTPDHFQAGDYPITFTAANLLTGSATTDVTVTNVDRAPVVTAPATASVAEDGLLTVNVTASDPDGEPIVSLDAADLPAGATFTPDPGNASGTLSWTPDFAQAGSYAVTFTASNALSGSAATDITVANTDRAPVVTAPVTATVAEDGLLTVNVTASDPDGDPIASFYVSDLPAGAMFTSDPGNASGTLTWTPDFSQAGSYGVTFTADNALSGFAVTEVTVTNTDRAPVVTAPATATVAEDGLLTVGVTAADPDGDPIASLDAGSLPAGAMFTPDPGNASGTLTWTPDFTQAGSYSVTFTASNALSGSGATDITVTNSDRAPVVTAPATATVAEDGLLTVSVTAADPDGEAIASLDAGGMPAGATFTPGPGNASGTLTWTPDFTQAGSYNVSFTASNARSGSASMDITVTNTDRAPVVSAPATAGVAEGQLLTVNVSASDPDGEPITSLTASNLPAGATFTPGPGNTSGALTWTPGFTQAGGYSVTFTASNVLAASGSTAITVTNTDRAPVVTAPVTASVGEGQLLTVNFTVSDPDGDPITSLGATGVPPGATMISGPGNTSGTLSWTPSFTQAGSYSVTFTATNARSGSATTAITVTNTDRAPVVTAPATASVAENGSLTLGVTAADPDGEPIASLAATGLPAGATFTPGPGNTSGTFAWTPDYFQAGSHNVAFTASNALAGSATTAITVTNVDRSPILSVPVSATVAEGQLLTVEVTVGDPDGEPITLLEATGLPAGATFTPAPGNTSGTLTWTPDHDQAGSYGVTFNAGNAIMVSGTTAITVTNNDRAPVVTAPAAASVAEGQLLTVSFTVADPDGEPITSLGATGLPPGAAFTSGEGYVSGTLTWTPDFSQAGSYNVTFTATNAITGSATTVITVTDTDRAPVVTAPAAVSVSEGDSLTVAISVLDPDGDAIASLTAAGVPEGATFTPGPGNTSGTLKWTPGYAQAGGYSVRFTAANALSGSDTTQITVTNTISSPIVTSPVVATVEADDTLTFGVTVVVASGDPIDSLTVSGLPPGAVFTPNQYNTSALVTWIPGPGDVGEHVVVFTAHNSKTGSDTTVIRVNPRTTDAPGGVAAVRLPPRVVPNPIRHAGYLRFALAKEGALRVDLFDLSGRLVGTPLDEAHAKPGTYEVPLGSSVWDSRPLPSGLYFFRIQSPDGTSRGRFLVRR